jgi:predicted RNA binding protein YcfA (HicA-like mRNA interferase family)
MPRLPQISGRELIRLLVSLGYEVIRQKGSHIRVSKRNQLGEHNLTVPDHDELAKGTLNDLLTQVSLWNNISKRDLIERLR